MWSYFFKILIVFLLFGCVVHLRPSLDVVVARTDFQKKLEKCLYYTIDSLNISDCHIYASDKKKTFDYYKAELPFFSIDEALLKINDLYVHGEISKHDSIILVLFYPAVGFDPAIGYTTILYFKKNDLSSRGCEMIFKKNGKLEQSVILSDDIWKAVNYYESLHSGCGTGFALVAYIDVDLEILSCHVAIDVDVFSNAQ